MSTLPAGPLAAWPRPVFFLVRTQVYKLANVATPQPADKTPNTVSMLKHKEQSERHYFVRRVNCHRPTSMYNVDFFILFQFFDNERLATALVLH